MFLADHQLKALLGGPNSLVTGFPEPWRQLQIGDSKWDSRESPVQPCSIDLHIGEIYIPGSKPPTCGGGTSWRFGYGASKRSFGCC